MKKRIAKKLVKRKLLTHTLPMAEARLRSKQIAFFETEKLLRRLEAEVMSVMRIKTACVRDDSNRKRVLSAVCEIPDDVYNNARDFENIKHFAAEVVADQVKKALDADKGHQRKEKENHT